MTGKIILKGVSKAFGEHVIIPSIDLEIDEGEFVVFVGPSGCGKSTLLRLIAGLEDATAGRIEIDTLDVSNVPPARRGLSMVFQSYALYPHMSVRGNIGFGLKMAGESKEVIRQKVEKAAAVLNLTAYLDRKPRQLSGGQRQRVAGPEGVTVGLPGGQAVVAPVAANGIRPGAKATLGIRPEHLRPAETGQLAGEVAVAERLGGETYFYLRLPDQPLVVAQAEGN